jgi:hypothetical protein
MGEKLLEETEDARNRRRQVEVEVQGDKHVRATTRSELYDGLDFEFIQYKGPKKRYVEFTNSSSRFAHWILSLGS